MECRNCGKESDDLVRYAGRFVLHKDYAFEEWKRMKDKLMWIDVCRECDDKIKNSHDKKIRLTMLGERNL